MSDVGADSPRLALKVDVDTYVGTVEGVPRLLDLFAKEGIRATFFFSLGPDTSGKAIKRVFKKGFVKKVLRANPAVSYGVKTMLYGTLLPAPDIGARKESIARMHEAREAGHECGIHAWDHIDWHDRLPSMTREEVVGVVGRAHARFFDVFGFPATLSAAPGWTATALSVDVQEAHGILATSDTREGEPFHPLRTTGRPSRAIEIPTTLPTLDELLALDTYGASKAAREKTVDLLAGKVRNAPGVSVHSIHTEIEGGRALHPLFRLQVSAWKADGVRFVTLGQTAEELRKAPAPLPARALGFTTLPGRATPVATGTGDRPAH